MSLSKRSIEMLLDLVEIKLSYMDISDREDARDMQILERCKEELRALDLTSAGYQDAHRHLATLKVLPVAIKRVSNLVVGPCRWSWVTPAWVMDGGRCGARHE